MYLVVSPALIPILGIQSLMELYKHVVDLIQKSFDDIN